MALARGGFHHCVMVVAVFFAALLILAGCKSRGKGGSCAYGELASSATVAEGAESTWYMVGGFLEIWTPDGSSFVQCDALVMPHQSRTSDLAGHYSHFRRVTVSVSRSCLNPLRGSKAFLVFYLHSYDRSYQVQGQQDHYGYVKVPVKSDYLEVLGNTRSDFIAAYAGDQNLGAQRLHLYELIQTQIYRFYKADYKGAFKEDGIAINDLDVDFFDRLQVRSCAVGSTYLEVRVEESESYDKMVEALENPPASGWACFVYSDFAQFDAMLDLTDEQRQQVSALQVQHRIQDRILTGETEGFDREEKLALLDYVRALASKSYNELVLMQKRVQSVDVAKLTRLSMEEIEHYLGLQSRWRGLSVYGLSEDLNALQKTNRVLGNLGRFLKGVIKLPNRRTMATPLENGGAALYPHASLSVMGNITSRQRWMSWRRLALASHAKSTQLYHSYFALFSKLQAPESGKGEAYHPLQKFQSGALIVLGGYPIGILKTVNRERVGWVSGARIAEYNLQKSLKNKALLAASEEADGPSAGPDPGGGTHQRHPSPTLPATPSAPASSQQPSHPQGSEPVVTTPSPPVPPRQPSVPPVTGDEDAVGLIPIGSFPPDKDPDMQIYGSVCL